MLELELAVELTHREVSRAQQLLLTLTAREPKGSFAKSDADIYQKKANELEMFLGSLNELLTRYHAIPLSDAAILEPELQQEFFTVLDSLLRTEKWQAKPLLEAVAQGLRKTYDSLLEQVGKKEINLKEIKDAELASLRANMTQVFISLYQVDGFNIKKWAALLELISDLSASRPIYQKEEDVRAVIRAKEQKQKEGYAAIYLSPKAILPISKGQAAQDKSGHDLMFVKERSLRLENIIYFEHVTGRYVLKEGLLIRQGDSSFL